MINKENKIEKLKEGEKAAGISTVVIFLLALAEALVGFLSGSIILVTDALHNVSDSIASFASWFGLKISQKKPDEKFPYGYYKAESITTFFVSIFILYAAYELFTEGYSKLFVISELTMPFYALAIASVTAIVSFFLARYMKNSGKKINSQTLIANSKERMTHVLASIIIFVAILLTFFKVPYVEGIITMFFSLLVLKTGIFTAKDSIFALMDISPSREIEERVKNIINSNAGIEGYDELKLRKSGPFVFGEVKVKIRKSVDVKRAHEISDSIEKEIKNKIEDIESFTIHVEPYESEYQKIIIPIVSDKGLDSNVMENFGRANYFMFITLNKKERKIISRYVKKNPHKEKLVKAGLAAVNFIVKEKVYSLIAGDVGEISFHTLRDNLIDIYRAKGKTVGINVNNFLKNRMEHISEPKKVKEEKQTTPKKTIQEKVIQIGRRRFRGGRSQK